MNKKSAIATAGGLVASFVAGVAAVSFNWGLGGISTAATPSATSSPTQPAKVKPIVKHRTITIHKKSPAPKPTAPNSQTIVLAAPPAAAPAPVATTSGSHAAGGEDEGEHEREGGGDD